MKKSTTRFIILVILIVVGIFLSRFFDINFSDISTYINSFGKFGPLIFILVYILGTIVFLPGTPLTLAGGALFGAFFGSLYVVIGATLGALIAFFISRYFGEKFIEKMINKSHLHTLSRYNDTIEKNGLLAVLFLRFIPLFPFNGLNFALGLTKVRARDYALGTFFGIMPGTFSYAYFGGALASFDLSRIIVAFFILVLFGYGISLYKKFASLDKDVFDIIVIGAGAGGLNIAGFMNKAGFKTLLIDKSDKHIGGDCLNFGCVPSKALLHVASIVAHARQSERFGMRVDGILDMQKITSYITEKQDIIRVHENTEYFKKQGMTVVLGMAKFVSLDEVMVGGKKYRGKKIVVATGSVPRKLEIPGIEKADIYNNESIFSISRLPKKLVVIGGGPVSLEIAQAFAYLGSEVSVIQRGDALLVKEDKEVVDVLVDALKKDGIRFYCNHSPKEFISADKLVILNENGEERVFEYDAVFVGIGREVRVDSLDVTKAHIETKDGKMKIDRFLRTTNKRVHVCGDVAGMHQFTHAAELHAALILRNFFAPLKRKLHTDNLSWVTYTSPQIATFGLNEQELKKRNIAYEVLKSDFTDDDKAIIGEYRHGLVKLFVGKGKILGGTMVAPHAGELFQELVLAQSTGMPMKKIFAKIYPYPTASRINKKVISMYFARKLSDVNKKILKALFH